MIHTPGPWTVEEPELAAESGEFTHHSYIHAELDGGTVITIAEVWGNKNQQKADANLIAAAPDLLAARKQAWQWLCVVEESHLKSPAGASVLERLDAAIAKAEGK